MFTIALVNQKGGVGKSTTAVNLSAGLARLGKRVLLIDLDPQAHATLAMGLQPRQLTHSVYSMLCGRHTAREVIRPVQENLWVIPTTIDLAGGEAELAARPNSHFTLKRALDELPEGDFDFAIIDSPPQLGFLNINSLAWVREVFIPVQCEFYALHGLALLMNTIERVQSQLNPALQVSAVIPCQVNPRRGLTRDVLAELEKHFPGRVLKSHIRVNVRLAEAPGHGKTIFDYAPESNGAQDYAALAGEVIALPPPPPFLGRTASLDAIAEVQAPAPEPEIETVAAAAESEPLPMEPVMAEAEIPEAEIVTTEVQPMEVAFASVESRAPEPEPEPIHVPVATAPAPVLKVTAPLTDPGSFAHKLAMAGLKPIVVARKPVPGEVIPQKQNGEGGLTSRLLGKLFGKKS